ncbi:MAG: hypothetical protein M1124_00705 [Candidatus Marsarchaeota archaeon]|jgi:N-glycosylase/DNA lyase|nr:hypothetical protein [Candidatus Marsarchaeota archaeon]
MMHAILKPKDFSLKYSFESGQPLAFYADFLDNTLSYSLRNHTVQARQDADLGALKLKSDSIQFAKTEILSRFRFNDDMERIYDEISTDRFMVQSIQKYRGLRITLNDPWETLVVFIISQNNNIKRIRNSTLRLIERFGRATQFGKEFPLLDDFADATESDFKAAGLGFRSRYMLHAIEYCTDNLDLRMLRNKDSIEIKQELMEIRGVGDKIADCVALMGYGKLDAFPIDVWIKRALEKVYFKGSTINIDRLHDFAADKWGKYAGYAQQYLYWNARNNFSTI